MGIKTSRLQHLGQKLVLTDQTNVSPGGKNKPETKRAAVTQNMTTTHTEGHTI